MTRKPTGHAKADRRVRRHHRYVKALVLGTGQGLVTFSPTFNSKVGPVAVVTVSRTLGVFFYDEGYADGCRDCVCEDGE